MHHRSSAALAAALLATLGPAAAQQNATWHQNCAMQADLAGDLTARDARSADAPERPATEGALRAFADGHEARMTAKLEAGYAQAAAYGWDRARVDAEHEKLGRQTYEAHIQPALDAGRITTDLVMALNTCATGDPEAWNQDEATLSAALNQLFAWARS